MATIDLRRRVDLPAPLAFARLTDFPTHGDWVPFTKVSFRHPGEPGGGGFVARTALGPLGFDDVNVLVRWQEPDGTQPGVAELDKAGWVVRGRATLTVTPVDDTTSDVRWQEEIRVVGVPALADPLVAASARVVFSTLVTGLFTRPDRLTHRTKRTLMRGLERSTT